MANQKTENKKEPKAASLTFSQKGYKIIKYSTIIFVELEETVSTNDVNKKYNNIVTGQSVLIPRRSQTQANLCWTTHFFLINSIFNK